MLIYFLTIKFYKYSYTLHQPLMLKFLECFNYKIKILALTVAYSSIPFNCFVFLILDLENCYFSFLCFFMVLVDLKISFSVAMNRRNKPVPKKLDFEPNIPVEQPKEPVKEVPKLDQSSQEEDVKPANSMPQSTHMKGFFAPKTFFTPKDINIATSKFVFNLPSSFKDCSLVVFSDNSLGIKMDGKIYECDSSYIGDGLVVDIGEKARKVGAPDFVVTGYPYPKLE